MHVNLSHNVTNNVTGLGHEDHGDAEHAPNRHLVEHILHMASLTILSIFFVEVICKIIAEGTHLLKHKAEVFDAIVVVVSFTMDVTFTFVSVTEAARDYAGLLVLLRLWRFTRIINGVILSVKMDADKKIKKEIVLRKKAEQQVQRLTDKCDQLTADNEKLRAKLKRMISNGGTVTTPSERSERSFPVEGMDRTMSERSNLTGLDRTMSERTFSVQPSLDRTMSEKNFTSEGINRSMSDKSNGEASMNDCPSPSDKGVS